MGRRIGENRGAEQVLGLVDFAVGSLKSRAVARMLAEAMRHGVGRGVANSGERYQSGRGVRDPWFDPDRAYVVDRVNIADGVVLGKLYLPAWMGAEEAREVWEQSIAAGE